MALDTGALTNDLTLYVNNLLFGAMDFIVGLVLVLIFLIIGYLVAKIVNSIILKALQGIRLEEWVKNRNLQGALGGFTLTGLILLLVKVSIVIAFLGAAVQVVQVAFFTELLGGLLGYIVSLTKGLVIVVAFLFVSKYLTNIIRSEKRFLSGQVAFGIRALLAYIAIIIALPFFLPGANVEVLIQLLTLLLQAVILAFGLAVGLALGLGLKDSVSKAAAKNQPAFDSFFGKLGKK